MRGQQPPARPELVGPVGPVGPNVKKYSVKSILHIHQMINMKCHMVSERATTSQARASGASGASGGAKCQKVLGEIHSPYPSDDRYEVP